MKGAKFQKIIDILGRKTILISFAILIVILVIATIVLIKGAIEENKEEHIVYTESSFVDYNVYLNKNDFYNKEYLEKDRQYIASLIEHITANFKYNLTSSAPNIEHKYTYKIVATTNVLDKASRNPIYNFDEVLLEDKTLTFNTSNKLIIDESIKIDYNKYNNIISDFIKVYNLDDINSTLTIKMYVKVDGVSVSSAPVATLNIPLTKKTMAIDISSNSVNATELSVYKEIANKNNSYIAVLTGILTVLVAIELFMFTNNTKDAEALYKNKVKKILLNYDSYIQKINNKFDYEDYQKIEMKSFEDLLQIRDTISQPILMMENEAKKETNFIIPSKGEVVYTYKVTIDEFLEKEDNIKQKSKEKIKV